jgi:hypothetical protein
MPTATDVRAPRFFSNAGINRLAAHFSLHQFAWSISGAFFATFLLPQWVG